MNYSRNRTDTGCITHMVAKRVPVQGGVVIQMPLVQIRPRREPNHATVLPVAHQDRGDRRTMEFTPSPFSLCPCKNGH